MIGGGFILSNCGAWVFVTCLLREKNYNNIRYIGDTDFRHQENRLVYAKI